jgi:hypothetical protein
MNASMTNTTRITEGRYAPKNIASGSPPSFRANALHRSRFSSSSTWVMVSSNNPARIRSSSSFVCSMLAGVVKARDHDDGHYSLDRPADVQDA